jgi:hypothetical protein
MKICAAFLLLLALSFPLFAQTAGGVSIYVPPVTGAGPVDNDSFHAFIVRRLEERNYLIFDTPEEAAFTLTARLVPQHASDDEGDGNKGDYEEYTGETLLPFGGDENTAHMYVLHLTLTDNETEETAVVHDLFFTDPNEIRDLFILPHVQIREYAYATGRFGSLSGSAGGADFGEDAWRNQQWYFGATAFWTPRVYTAEKSVTHYINFGFSLSAEYHFIKFAEGKLEFLKYLSVGTGVELFPDWIVLTDRQGDSYRDLVLEIPLLVKGVFKLSGHFMLEPYAGVNLNLALYGETKPPLFAWRAGFQYGVKAGPGALVIEPWFSMDFGRSRFGKEYTPDKIEYQRYMMHIGVGYK